MLVQHYYPQSLSPARLDKFLASGWFRSAPMLYRSQLICLEGDVFSTVNIRLRLKDYEFKRSLRKILRRNNTKFRTFVQKANLDQAKQRLYDGQKHRFKGFIFDSLNQFFFANMEESVFNTYEVNVYDGDELVAVSFFDQGKKSVASILGLYNQNYEKYSLGTYTMLLEIDYSLKTGKKYYYPGYILDQPSVFDYKLRLDNGTMEYYNWKGRWRPYTKLGKERLLVHDLREKMREMQACLQIMHIPFEKKLYPLFSVGYLVFFENSFLRSTIYLSCFPDVNPQRMLLIEYLLEEEIYRLSWVSTCPEYQEFINMSISSDLNDSHLYCLDLLKYEEIILQDAQPFSIARKVLRLL